MHTEFHRISWIYERGGGSYLLNLNSNLNPVEKEEKRKINLKERKSRIYIYTRNIRSRVFIDAAGTQVRISISKLLDLPRFDSTDYRFVVRTTFPSTTIHWQLEFIKISYTGNPSRIQTRIIGRFGSLLIQAGINGNYF